MMLRIDSRPFTTTTLMTAAIANKAFIRETPNMMENGQKERQVGFTEVSQSENKEDEWRPRRSNDVLYPSSVKERPIPAVTEISRHNMAVL